MKKKKHIIITKYFQVMASIIRIPCDEKIEIGR